MQKLLDEVDIKLEFTLSQGDIYVTNQGQRERFKKKRGSSPLGSPCVIICLGGGHVKP